METLPKRLVRLQQAIQRHDIKLPELAERIDASYVTLWRWYNGKTTPSDAEWDQLQAAVRSMSRWEVVRAKTQDGVNWFATTSACELQNRLTKKGGWATVEVISKHDSRRVAHHVAKAERRRLQYAQLMASKHSSSDLPTSSLGQTGSVVPSEILTLPVVLP